MFYIRYRKKLVLGAVSILLTKSPKVSMPLNSFCLGGSSDPTHNLINPINIKKAVPYAMLESAMAKITVANIPGKTRFKPILEKLFSLYVIEGRAVNCEFRRFYLFLLFAWYLKIFAELSWLDRRSQCNLIQKEV